jgi:hypothetical protein
MPESVIEHVLGHLKTIGIEDIFGADRRDDRAKTGK